jgi:hypothetical protein
MPEKTFTFWVGALFILFIWFGLWEGILHPLFSADGFTVLSVLKLIAGLLALGIGIVMDQLECIKDLLKHGEVR